MITKSCGIPDRLSWIPSAAWMLLGLFTVHRPVERLLARYVLRLRPLPPKVRKKLEPAWREVLARAAVDPDRVDLWLKEGSIGAAAGAPAGHIVSVNGAAVITLSSGQLASILAHELGHHSGGHAWAALITRWWSLPAQLIVRGLSGFVRGLLYIYGRFGVLGFLSVLALTAFGAALVTDTWYAWAPILLVPFYSAAVMRRAELRADDYAARLGFASQLSQVLDRGRGSAEPSDGGPGIARVRSWLAWHPDARTRLRHLDQYLTNRAASDVSGKSPENEEDRLRDLSEDPDFTLAAADVVQALTRVFLTLGPPPEGVMAESVRDEPVPSGGMK
ncbi:M48 family metalloprotease [Streptomyces sp. NPDC102395]|uniref:M48 family metalloprotease n=1 Tax=Streptomyces sp. NPDC102395 TaxID=3366168 RepID=UPI0037F27478